MDQNVFQPRVLPRQHALAKVCPGDGRQGRGGGDVDLRLLDPVSKVVLVAPGRFYKEGSQIQTHPETRRGVHRQLKV